MTAELHCPIAVGREGPQQVASASSWSLSALERVCQSRPSSQRGELLVSSPGRYRQFPHFRSIERRWWHEAYRDRAGIAENITIEISLGRVNACMGRQIRHEIPWLTFLGDDRTHAHLCDKGRQTSSRIDKCSLSHPLDPLLCRIGFHLGGSVEAESLRISENLDYLVGDDLRLKERSSDDHARSPSRVHANADRTLHGPRLPRGAHPAVPRLPSYHGRVQTHSAKSNRPRCDCRLPGSGRSPRKPQA